MEDMIPLNPREEEPPLNYEKAIASTIDKKRSCCGKLAQILIVFIA